MVISPAASPRSSTSRCRARASSSRRARTRASCSTATAFSGTWNNERALMGSAFALAVLALWEVLSRGGVLAEDGVARPTRFFVAGAKALADGTLLAQTAQTFGAAAQALVIATVAGGTLRGMLRPLLPRP